MNFGHVSYTVIIGGLRIGPGWKGASSIKGLLFTIFSSALFMEFTGSVVCMQLVFLVSILVLPGQVRWLVDCMIDGIRSFSL